MNIIRKIKISKLTNVSFSEEEQEIIDLIVRKLRYLTSYVYNDVTVYTNVMSDFIFEANHRSKKIYVHKHDFWDLIEHKIGYESTQVLLSYFIKHNYEHYSSFYVMPKYF